MCRHRRCEQKKVRFAARARYMHARVPTLSHLTRASLVTAIPSPPYSYFPFLTLLHARFTHTAIKPSIRCQDGLRASHALLERRSVVLCVGVTWPARVAPSERIVEVVEGSRLRLLHRGDRVCHCVRWCVILGGAVSVYAVSWATARYVRCLRCASALSAPGYRLGRRRAALPGPESAVLR